MTTQPMSAEQAARSLRSAGYLVKQHGARYLVGDDRKILTDAELVNLASNAGEAPARWTAECGQCGQQFISDAPIADGACCPSCAGTPAKSAPIGAISNSDWPSIPLMELLAILEAHAKRLGTPTPETVIPVPPGMPNRLLVPIGAVVAGRYQPRSTFGEAELAELADSIRAHGIVSPPLVFANEKAELELIAGERRLRAAYQVGLTMLPIELRSYTLRQIAEISGIDNLQRAQLSAIEKGRYFNRLISELRISENALAKRLGIGRTGIQQCRAVALGAAELHQALEAEQISFSQARAIALSAPGDHAAQKQVVTVIQVSTRHGRAMSEAETRAETENIVRKRLEGDLKKLGWQITTNGEVWSESERPRKWTGAEMLEAVKETRRPSGQVPAGEISAEILALARLRFDQAPLRYGQWVGLSETWSKPFTYYGPDELPALAAESQALIDAITARAKVHGWQFEWKGGNGHFQEVVFIGPNGGRERKYYWSDVEKTLARIESGDLIDYTSQSTNNAPSRSQHKCGDCGKATSESLRYIDGAYRCDACSAPILAAREAAQAVQRAKIDTALGAWLRAAPAGALALLIAACSGDAIDEQVTAETLIGDIATYASEWEIDPEVEPAVAALLGMVEPAEELPGLTEGSPLYGVSTAITNLVKWQCTSLDKADTDELQVTAAEVTAIRTALEALTSAPDVSDADFDALSTRLGVIERAIQGALVSEVPA